MKGQYLAIESVLTFAMGITLAIGTISIFTNYQDQIKESTRSQEADIIKNKLKTSIYDLKGVDSGSKDITLPEDIGGSSYTVALSEGIRIRSAAVNENEELNNLRDFNMKGNAQGGQITLYKTNNEYILRSN